MQTAHFLHQANDTFAKLGVKVDGAQLDFAAANEWKAGVVKQMTGGVAGLFKANGVEWVKGVGTFKDANTIAVEGGEDVKFKSAIIATGSFPLRPPIPGLESDLCVDSTGLLAQTEVPKRLVILGGGIIGSEFASIFNRFGSEVTIVEMLDTLIPQEDADAAKELAKAFGKRGIALQLGKQCTKVEQQGNALTVSLRRGRVGRVRPDARVGRPRAARRGHRPRGRRRRVRQAQGHRHRRPPPHERAAHLRGRRLRRLLAARAHGVPRGRGRRRERDAATRRSSTTAPCRARSTPIRRSPGVGLTEAEAREQYGDDVAVGVFPWVANARAVMQDETVGWVKSIHETRYGELLGLVMVGPHVTDLIEAGTVAIDARRRSRRSPTAWRRTRRSPRRSRKPASSRSAARSTCRTRRRRRRRLRRTRVARSGGAAMSSSVIARTPGTNAMTRLVAAATAAAVSSVVSTPSGFEISGNATNPIGMKTNDTRMS